MTASASPAQLGGWAQVEGVLPPQAAPPTAVQGTRGLSWRPGADSGWALGAARLDPGRQNSLRRTPGRTRTHLPERSSPAPRATGQASLVLRALQGCCHRCLQPLLWREGRGRPQGLCRPLAASVTSVPCSLTCSFRTLSVRVCAHACVHRKQRKECDRSFPPGILIPGIQSPMVNHGGDNQMEDSRKKQSRSFRSHTVCTAWRPAGCLSVCPLCPVFP